MPATSDAVPLLGKFFAFPFVFVSELVEFGVCRVRELINVKLRLGASKAPSESSNPTKIFQQFSF